MQTNMVAASAKLARITLTAAALAFIGFAVGISCVILPQGAPIGIIALAVLIFFWTLPDLQMVPGRLSYWLIFPLIVSCLSIPVYFAIIAPGLPWISIRRVILFLFVGVVVTTISASSSHRAFLVRTGKSLPPVFMCSVGYFTLIVATILISSKKLDSINSVINTTMAWWLPAIAVMVFVRKTVDINRIFCVIVVCMLFDMAIGMVEARMQSPFLIYMLPASMRTQMLIQFPMYAGLLVGSLRNGIYRGVSTYNVGLSWGEMAAMVGPIAAHFLAHGRSGLVRTFGTVSLAGCLYSIYMSGSRGAYVGFTAAMIAYFALWAIRHMRVKPASLMGGLTLVLYSMFSIAVVLAIIFVGRIHRVVLGGGEVQASNDGRALEWAMALPKIYRSPIWGYGTGTAADVVGFFNAAGNPTLDSYIINVLIDTGLIGLVLFTIMILGSAFFAIRTYVTNIADTATYCGALGCSLIAYALYRLTLSQTENNALAFILVGLIFVVHHILQREGSSPVPSSVTGPIISGRREDTASMSP